MKESRMKYEAWRNNSTPCDHRLKLVVKKLIDQRDLNNNTPINGIERSAAAVIYEGKGGDAIHN